LLSHLGNPKVGITVLSSTSSEACLKMRETSMYEFQGCNVSSTPTYGDLPGGAAIGCLLQPNQFGKVIDAF